MTLFAEDERWMDFAIALAKKASLKGEVPVAAVVVGPEGLVSAAINSRERQQSPLGHAELIALHKASKKRASWRLQDCTLYVTLEPCLMCAGAIQESRVQRVVYGASDPNGGTYAILQGFTDVTPGVKEPECSDVLKTFFKSLRDEKNSIKAKRVFRKRASVVVVHRNKILGFHAQDPLNQKPYFFIPGGAVELNESPASAAQRECLEETGYKIRILEDSMFERKYDFLWNGVLNHCQTFFYLGVLDQEWTPPQKILDAEYHLGVDWVDVKSAPEVFNYSKDILWAVQKLLKLEKKKRALR